MSSMAFGADFGTTKLTVSSMEDEETVISPRGVSHTYERITDVTPSILYELFSAVQPSFTSNKKRKIENLIVALPGVWYKDINCPEQRYLESLFEGIELERECWNLIPQAIAIAAYWLVKQQLIDFQGNLLICDVGRNTLQVHLCCISENSKIKVIYSDKTESAGLAFDVQCVQLSYFQKHGLAIDRNDPKWECLLKYFEAEKIRSHARSSQRILAYLNAPEVMEECNLYCFGGGYIVKCHQISEAFAPIKQGIWQTLGKLQTYMYDQKHKFDYIVVTGGFSQFPLVQQTIQQAFSMHDDSRWDDCFNSLEKSLAVSYGASLIANRKIDPIENFPYTFGIISEELDPYLERKQKYIPLVFAGTDLELLNVPRFTDVAQFSSFEEYVPSINTWISSQNLDEVSKEISVEHVQLNNFSSENIWQIGVRVSPEKILYLVIRDERLKQHTELELGKLSEVLPD